MADFGEFVSNSHFFFLPRIKATVVLLIGRPSSNEIKGCRIGRSIFLTARRLPEWFYASVLFGGRTLSGDHLSSNKGTKLLRQALHLFWRTSSNLSDFKRAWNKNRTGEPRIQITLFQAFWNLTNWTGFSRKVVELGVTAFVPFISETVRRPEKSLPPK